MICRHHSLPRVNRLKVLHPPLRTRVFNALQLCQTQQPKISNPLACITTICCHNLSCKLLTSTACSQSM
jgi:hypothetical protein